jgi:hypothetical protein
LPDVGLLRSGQCVIAEGFDEIRDTLGRWISFDPLEHIRNLMKLWIEDDRFRSAGRVGRC